MTGAAIAAVLADGRLHLQHGPIDLIIDAKGDQKKVGVAYQAMSKRFATVLDELVLELTSLRRDISEGYEAQSDVAKRMVNATRKFGDVFVTPMAAVAGSVADEIIEVGWRTTGLTTLYVNNGGDIAFRLSEGEELVVGVAKSVSDGSLVGRLHLSYGSSVRGVATSGFGGRSRTFGIADAVTVLSSCAAQADVAATLIANAVSLGQHPQVQVVAANSLDESSDLGSRLVTRSVGFLSEAEIDLALASGVRRAEVLCEKNGIEAVFLSLRDRVRSIGRFDYR